MVRFVDTTCVQPRVVYAVPLSLFSTEPDLVIACFILVGTIRQVSENDLLGICTPCVRTYRIAGNIVVDVLGEAELAAVVAP